MADIRVGEPFPLDDDNVGDCDAVHDAWFGQAYCVFDAGHGGPRVASDGEAVVEVWH